MRTLSLTALVAILLLSVTACAGRATAPGPVLAVEAGTNGSLWILGEQRLLRLAGDDHHITPLPDPARRLQARSLAVSVDGTFYIAGEGLGIYRSTDGGGSWEKVGDRTPGNNVNVVVTHATLNNVVYAHDPEKGIFRSTNAGDDWVRVDAGPREPVLTFLHSNMEGSMETGWLFAGTGRGVSRSMDCFCFWSDAGALRGEVTALAYDPEAPMNVYALAGNALHHSTDGGENWSRMAAPDNVSDLAVAGGRLYAGTSAGLFVHKGDATWERIDG